MSQVEVSDRGMVDNMVRAWVAGIDDVALLDRWYTAIENKLRALNHQPRRAILSDPELLPSASASIHARWWIDGEMALLDRVNIEHHGSGSTIFSVDFRVAFTPRQATTLHRRYDRNR